GFYVSPAAVAPYGLLAIVMWIVMGIGAICLGLAFARLAAAAPATGGPYAYTRMGYGDFAGFLVGWVYWISIWASLPAIAFAYLGMESATVPAGDVRDPARTIPRATVLGIVIAAVFYVVGTLVVFGLVPHAELKASVSPFSDAARVLWGPWGAIVIAAAVGLS